MSTVQTLRSFLNGLVLGAESEVELLLVGVVAGGHVLIEGPPGTGKTSLARGLSGAIGGTFRRIQFTSDMLPSDISGCMVYDQGKAAFRFHPGPVFVNTLLADEINRASPRTQSALLEAMNEGQVTVDGFTHELPRPFMVVGTRNPTGAAGTFELPESQLDRFLLSLELDVPSADVQADILRRRRDVAGEPAEEGLVRIEELLMLQRQALEVRVSDSMNRYIVQLADAVRSHPENQAGVSVRALLALMRASQAAAVLAGRPSVYPEDVQQVACAVFRHRVSLRHEGSDVRRRVEHLLAACIESVAIPPRDG